MGWEVWREGVKCEGLRTLSYSSFSTLGWPGLECGLWLSGQWGSDHPRAGRRPSGRAAASGSADQLAALRREFQAGWVPAAHEIRSAELIFASSTASDDVRRQQRVKCAWGTFRVGKRGEHLMMLLNCDMRGALAAWTRRTSVPTCNARIVLSRIATEPPELNPCVVPKMYTQSNEQLTENEKIEDNGGKLKMRVGSVWRGCGLHHSFKR